MPADQSRPTGINRARFLVINGFIFGYLVLTPLLFITKYEAWPVCTYGMYQGTFTRHHQQTMVEYYTLAGTQTTWIDLMSGPILQWDYTFDGVIKKFGLHSATTRKFLGASLEQLRIETQTRDPRAPLPTAIQVYSSDYRSSDSGDYQPVLQHRTLLLEVDREAP